ncbi:hypothetical protein SprV_0100254400 [Sparganum proliferum]
MDHPTAPFQDIWRQEETPQDFRDVTILHLYKRKGNRQICDKYRGISPLNIVGKIFALILLNRLNNYLEQGLLPDSQCGFHCHRGITNMIFVVRQLQEKWREMRTHLCYIFVNLTKAFYTSYVLCHADGRLLRQTPQDPLRPQDKRPPPQSAADALPIACIHNHRPQPSLRDDCALNPTTGGDIQRDMDLFGAACDNIGLIINTEKTVVMHQPPPNRAPPHNAPQISVDATQLQAVDNLIYLGSTLSSSTKIDN